MIKTTLVYLKEFHFAIAHELLKYFNNSSIWKIVPEKFLSTQ